MIRRALEKQTAYCLLRDYLPDDHSRQMRAETVAMDHMPKRDSRVLDVGCGTGVSIDLFRKIASIDSTEIDWNGVDIEDSPEVRERTRCDGKFQSFDGVNLPYEDCSFDVVYTDQVFEHVRHPDALMREIVRVLRPGGLFLGSVAYLEPFHSLSMFNFTPYGMVRVCEQAGLRVRELRPSVDAWTMLMRHLLRRPSFFRFFLERTSPFNGFVELFGRFIGLQSRHRNYVKLQYCAHFCFVAERPASMDA